MRGQAILALVVCLLAAGCAAPGRPPAPTPYYETVLAGAPFTELVIEVDHAPGRAPSEAALTHLRMTFENVTSKQTVTLKVEESLDEAARTWTADDLRRLEVDERTTPHEAPVAVLHVLYPAGEYERAGVAGVTIGGPVIGPAVVFLDTIRKFPMTIEGRHLGDLPLPEESVQIIERSTLVHEAGHAVGLVNNGLAMVCPHEDPQHEGHSDNENSIMYYAVDSLEGMRKMLTGDGQVPDKFDVNDLRDIQSAGGRGLPPPAAGC